MVDLLQPQRHVLGVEMADRLRNAHFFHRAVTAAWTAQIVMIQLVELPTATEEPDTGQSVGCM